ncbi:TetR/AcrR family transcriptional regulator [Bordetella petrii]|uniref:TetR/AcrR family transcriptional regulator n=1 Tax=Bordetella petrii TaxID=94624 RepID=UPI001A95B3C8|nr:TetR/AcrR family transcriptional regulator [Bordetella petrii]MBO1113416.1 TetR/AcrR family transcriptional regulator [Bordetella petrii]
MKKSDTTPSSGTRPEPPPQPTGKELAVLTAAREVFLTHGFSAATTDMIQRAAGVSKATVYAYYPTKQALFTAVIEGKCAEHMKALRALRSVPGGIHAVLSELASAYLEFALAPEGLALFRVSAAEAPRFPELARTFYENGPEAYCGIVAEHIERGVQNRELDLGDASAHEAARLFFSLVRGQAQMEGVLLPDRRPSRAQKKRWADLAVGTFFAAFGKG